MLRPGRPTSFPRFAEASVRFILIFRFLSNNVVRKTCKLEFDTGGVVEMQDAASAASENIKTVEDGCIDPVY